MTFNDKIDKRNRILIEFSIIAKYKIVSCMGVSALKNIVDRVINSDK